MSSVLNNSDEQEKAIQDEENDFIRQVGWKALFGFTTKKHIPVLLVALFCATVSALTLPAFAVVYGLIFRQFASFGSGEITGTVLLRNASKYCTYLTALAAINWFSNSLYFAMYLTFGELQASNARNRIYDALLRKDMAWYDTRRSGITAFLPAIQSQIRDLQLSTSQPFGEAVQCFVQSIGAIIVAFYFSWNLTLVIICSVPLVYLAMAFLSQRLSKRSQEQAEKLQQALKYLTSAIQSIETVKCFNGQQFELQRYSSAIARAAGLYTRQANYRSIQIGFMQFFTLSVFVQGFWYGSHLVVTGQKTPGQVVTTFWGALMAVQGVTGFLPQFIILQKGKVAGATLRAMITRISKHDEGTETQGEEKPVRCVGDVEFKQVTFSYPTRRNQTAIRNASMFFPAGETTFVVGRSGSGKSTLGQLLVRFYKPTSGQIFIDGVSLEKLDTKWLRENVTLVEQHSVLFNGSIRRNIALAKHDEGITREDVEEAAKFALLQQMVQDLPDGLETLVGMKGGSLSGGQKQRVALARARLRDTPVLILDESTSALDYVTRSAILEAIRNWRSGKTTIIITHDISQILPTDFVYVLDRAHVVQRGYRKAIEVETDSIFRTFFTTEQEASGEGDEPSDDETSEILSLYSVVWEDVSPAARPTSALFFGEQLRGSFLSPIRRSLIVPNRRPSISSESENIPSDGSIALGALKPPPVQTSASEALESLKNRAQRISRLSSTRSNHGSQARVAIRPKSIRREAPAPLQIEDTASPSKESRFRRRKQQEPLEISQKVVQQLTVMQIMRTVWPALPWHSRLAFVGAVVCTVIHSAATPTFAFVFSRLLSTFYTTENQQQSALRYALYILAIAVVDGLASYGFHFLFDACAQTWANTLKSEAMRRLLIQPREFFDRDENSVSRLAECLDQFAEEARNLPGRFAGIAIVIVTMIVIAVVWSLITCWKLTLVALGCGPILYAITAAFNAVSSRWETFANDADEEVGQLLHETFVNIRTVRCLALEDMFRKKYRETTFSALKVGMKRAIYSGSIFGLNYASVLFVSALLFWYGAYIVSTSEYGTTTIIQTFTILLLSVNHVNFIVSYIPQINTAKDAGSRLIRLARLPTNSHEHNGTIQLHTAGDIVLKNVSFAYPTRKDTQVLHDISFTIPRGSCVAIVGTSGSGKSTIAALLLKLYETTSSSKITSPTPDLTVSKHGIKTLHTATLRSRMAVVSQTPVLFPGTIAENIAYGVSPSTPQGSMISIRAAASSAGIADFIESLPQGYQTIVGEGGSGLSGGQAQRIAIARALARNPDILILDEATSALDVESAGIVRDTIQNLVMATKKDERGGSSSRADDRLARRDMTVIIITHAREMMAIAENIVMLDKGRVVEEGAFDELKRRRGPFARLLRGDAGE
ncbi:P-loop containing nucleoside triphosphate hydrolase protein [Melanomma pulvis-pyrius CBS 109.77]|uniref:P-loop containing nucleoside triphosphate hydrolase protein n=1 Tax=Melanomma pulvis-pyrius CBS 109.77 TaxID=1314802 RepID=A0A6A6XHZ0_9PLEO|nr:P-loop containing nucleoside triphosphate hydrolase protein [Melanomma pulvis-pyrius CBS 109.77]